MIIRNPQDSIGNYVSPIVDTLSTPERLLTRTSPSERALLCLRNRPEHPCACRRGTQRCPKQLARLSVSAWDLVGVWFSNSKLQAPKFWFRTMLRTMHVLVFQASTGASDMTAGAPDNACVSFPNLYWCI